MTEILTVRNLCKHYPAFELHDVSFSIRASSIMGLIGRNGAGKTTTIKSILRLVRPDGGSVEFLGQPVDDDAAALRREAGYVSGDLCYYPRKRLSQLTAVTRSFYSAWDSARYGTVAQSVSLAGFTAPWKKLTGPETALAPALRGALRGLRVHRGEFEALYPSDLPCPAGCREELADLQTVMVYLEREVETV